METYADYDFYREKYFGDSIPEPNFDYYGGKATAYIKYITFDRVEEITEAVQKAMCAAADVLYKNEQIELISSESVGRASVTYNTKGTVEKKMQSAVLPYLANTGLLSRGVK